MGINRVVISGNLTRDAQLTQSSGGTPILRLGVAVNDRRKNSRTGEWEDYPNFVDCVMFGTRAQGVSRHLTKGIKVAVEGRLRYSSWDKDGERRSKLEVFVDELEFMSRGDSGRSQATAANQAFVAAATTPVPSAAADLMDDDIPF